MKVNVKLFAKARDLAGDDSVELDLPESACVGDVKNALIERYPKMSSMISSLHIAVGSQYADDNAAVSNKAEIACFPPVSGG